MAVEVCQAVHVGSQKLTLRGQSYRRERETQRSACRPDDHCLRQALEENVRFGAAECSANADFRSATVKLGEHQSNDVDEAQAQESDPHPSAESYFIRDEICFGKRT